VAATTLFSRSEDMALQTRHKRRDEGGSFGDFHILATRARAKDTRYSGLTAAPGPRLELLNEARVIGGDLVLIKTWQKGKFRSWLYGRRELM